MVVGVLCAKGGDGELPASGGAFEVILLPTADVAVVGFAKVRLELSLFADALAALRRRRHVADGGAELRR